MNDREKVIKGLECCQDLHTAGPGYAQGCALCPFGETPSDGAGGYACFRAMVKDALVLLKAQEPVKPVMDIDTWKCGNCGHTLENQELLGDNVLFHEQYNYCPECGRAVKWE